MPVTTTLSNQYGKELINPLLSRTIKVLLMVPAFTFDPDTHNFLADVTAYQLADGNGYLQNDKALEGATIVRDDTNDRSYVAWNDPRWTAVGGAIGPFGSVLYVDTSLTDSPVVACTNFGLDGNNDQITVTIAENTAWLGQSLKFYSVKANLVA